MCVKYIQTFIIASIYMSWHSIINTSITSIQNYKQYSSIRMWLGDLSLMLCTIGMCSASKGVVLQLLVKAWVRADRRPGELHLPECVIKWQPFSEHQIANHNGGRAWYASVAVHQRDAPLETKWEMKTKRHLWEENTLKETNNRPTQTIGLHQDNISNSFTSTQQVAG